MGEPHYRRKSLGGMAGKAIKCLYTSGPDGTQIYENFWKTRFVIDNFGETMMVEYSKRNVDFQMEKDDMICTGIICLFQTSNPEVRHFIPYIKIGETWYNGDNEIGFLRKREGPPTTKSKIINDQGIEDSGSYLQTAILFYCNPQIIINPRTDDWSGRLVFGQLGLSCGPDALQTVLMFADGFYERFNLQLYNEMKQYIDPRFSYDGVIDNPYSVDDMVVQQIKLSEELVHRRTNTSYVNKDSLKFVAYMFIRYYAIETSPPLEYTPQENSIRTVVPNSNRQEYLTAIDYLKTHKQNNKNWNKFSKFVEDFVKLYPDFIPPFHFVRKEFGRLMQELYRVYAKTPEGDGRLGRVLLMIYYNLNLRQGETVKTKMITKYHEILDEYAKEHPDEITPFKPGEYDLVLEFYTFFKENWEIIMENLSSFQEEYDKIRDSHQEREKNSRQRKTRKMRKSRNSKSRKSRGS